jgi:hypothetical protein
MSWVVESEIVCNLHAGDSLVHRSPFLPGGIFVFGWRIWRIGRLQFAAGDGSKRRQLRTWGWGCGQAAAAAGRDCQRCCWTWVPPPPLDVSAVAAWSQGCRVVAGGSWDGWGLGDWWRDYELDNRWLPNVARRESEKMPPNPTDKTKINRITWL